MHWYRTHVLAPQIHNAMNKASLSDDRITATKGARGQVLEIGFGSGLNLPYYTDAVTKLYALEPFETLFEKSKPLMDKTPFPVEHLGTTAEAIPLPDNSIDYVVSTWTLCSIPNPAQALKEIERVLKPGGTFSFVEHGKTPNRFWGFVQELATPFTALCDGNCHLNRDVEKLLSSTQLKTMTLHKIPEPTYPLDFGYVGVATK